MRITLSCHGNIVLVLFSQHSKKNQLTSDSLELSVFTKSLVPKIQK